MRLPAGVLMMAAATVLVAAGCGDSAGDEDLPEAATPDHISLQGVDDEYLEGMGMTLKPPTESDSPEITPEKAEQVAGANGPGAADVREVVLAHLHDTNDTTEDDLLVWVVNFETEGEPPGMAHGSTQTGEAELKVRIAFVDATTGEWLYSMESSGPVD